MIKTHTEKYDADGLQDAIDDSDLKHSLVVALKEIQIDLNENSERKALYSNDYCSLDNVREYAYGLQCIRPDIRKLICKPHLEIDVENCHPDLLAQIIKYDNGFKCQNLEEYNNNRANYLTLAMNEFDITRKEAKQIFFAAIYDESSEYHTVLSDRIRREVNHIKKVFYNSDKYEHLRGVYYHEPSSIYGCVKRYKNEKTRLLAIIIEQAEREVLDCLVEFLGQEGIEIGAEMFDGVLVYGSVYMPLINKAEKYIQTNTDYCVKLNIK